MPICNLCQVLTRLQTIQRAPAQSHPDSELFGSLHAYVARKPHPRALGLCKISRTITASVRQQHEKKVCLSLQISATERCICHFRTGMLSRSRNLFGVRQVQQCGDLLKHKVQRCGDLPKRRHSVRQGVS